MEGFAKKQRVEPLVKREGDSFSVSLDSMHFVPVRPDLGKLMRLALRVQKRINDDPLSINREYSRVTDMVAGINCHKTVLFARGEISSKQLINSRIEADVNGHPEIISLANENPENMMFFTGDIKEYAHAHPDEFPFSVHILREMDGVWTPSHSILWLGTDDSGKDVCFHKAGPYLDMPFELTTLEDAVSAYDSVESVFLILPIPKQETPAEEDRLEEAA